MVLGVLRNHCGCAGVLARVMVVEPEVQLPLEVGQPVPAIPLQLGPCPPCDRDAVAHQVGSVDATGPTGGIHRLLVEIAVLDKVVLRQQGQKNPQGVCKPGCLRDMIRTDAVEPDVEWIEPGAGIDQHRECLDLVIGLHAGQTDLADACDIAACRFHI